MAFEGTFQLRGRLPTLTQQIEQKHPHHNGSRYTGKMPSLGVLFYIMVSSNGLISISSSIDLNDQANTDSRILPNRRGPDAALMRP